MKIVQWMILGAALLLAAQAQAQPRYQCRTAGGAAYMSDRPCGTGGPVYYGPTEPVQRNYQQPSYPGVGEAPEYIHYMSPYCSGLNDALRTASARGLSSSTVSEMRRNYQRECGEDEAQARSQYGRERGEKRQTERSAQDAQQRAQQQTQLQAQQCGESKRILVTKKQRTDLTDGEKADLQRFEANYHARCG